MRVGDAWEPTCRVPKSNDVNTLLVTPQPVNDTIRTANNFTQIGFLKFRDDAADFRKIYKVFGTNN